MFVNPILLLPFLNDPSGEPSFVQTYTRSHQRGSRTTSISQYRKKKVQVLQCTAVCFNSPTHYHLYCVRIAGPFTYRTYLHTMYIHVAQYFEIPAPTFPFSFISPYLQSSPLSHSLLVFATITIQFNTHDQHRQHSMQVVYVSLIRMCMQVILSLFALLLSGVCCFHRSVAEMEVTGLRKMGVSLHLRAQGYTHGLLYFCHWLATSSFVVSRVPCWSKQRCRCQRAVSTPAPTPTTQKRFCWVNAGSASLRHYRIGTQQGTHDD